MDAMTVYRNLYDCAAQALDGGISFELGYPVPAVVRGIFVERAFVIGTGNVRSRPFAWVEADALTGMARRFIYCADADFVEGVPLDATVDRTLGMGVEEFLRERKRLLEEYESVRRGGDIRAYAALFERLVPKGLRPYYKGLSPVFDAMITGQEHTIDQQEVKKMALGFEKLGRQAEQAQETPAQPLDQLRQDDAKALEQVEAGIEQAEKLEQIESAEQPQEEYDNQGSSCGRGRGCMGSHYCANY